MDQCPDPLFKQQKNTKNHFEKKKSLVIPFKKGYVTKRSSLF